ncbi:hypothetical protein ACQZT9_001040 [Enterococcus faecalis]
MKKQEMNAVSLRIIKLNFLGIRELNFQCMIKSFSKKIICIVKKERV